MCIRHKVKSHQIYKDTHVFFGKPLELIHWIARHYGRFCNHQRNIIAYSQTHWNFFSHQLIIQVHRKRHELQDFTLEKYTLNTAGLAQQSSNHWSSVDCWKCHVRHVYHKSPAPHSLRDISERRLISIMLTVACCCKSYLLIVIITEMLGFPFDGNVFLWTVGCYLHQHNTFTKHRTIVSCWFLFDAALIDKASQGQTVELHTRNLYQRKDLIN